MKETIEQFFAKPSNPTQKRYEALKTFFYEKKTAEQVAEQYGYTLSSVYSLTTDFRQWIKTSAAADYFFVTHSKGRKQKTVTNNIYNLIVELRKKYLSVPDIKAILDSQKYNISERYIYQTIKTEGFARLPRRSKQARNETINEIKPIIAPKSEVISKDPENFSVADAIGVLCLLPYIKEFGIDKLIEEAGYPGTKILPSLNSILSFVALKLSNIRRYTADDIWCMNRGLGLFAGLNVLPKTGWFSSYSHRITRNMNIKFLKSLHELWIARGWLSDTANLDFASIP